jgi:hypothetical protein
MDELDRGSFEGLLERALKVCRAKVHAFCWLKHELHLAVQVGRKPLGELVQRVTGRFAAQALARRAESHGHLFLHPFLAELLADDNLLPGLVRHIHRLPLTPSMNGDVAAYPWDSHRCYLGLEEISWLTTSTVMAMCGSNAETMAKRNRDLNFGSDAIISFQATDGITYLHWLADRRAVRRSSLSLTQLVDMVAMRLKVEPHRMMSPSRQRELSRARALTTWLATQNHIAKLSEVARHFDRDPSTLSSGVMRYQLECAELFAEDLQTILTK